MTDHDIQLLALGTALGIYIMLLIQIIGGVLDDRRDRRVARAAEAQLKAALERAEA
ncbi:hypothetical protein [Streptomyces cupreus]|uniref:Uncharacterized protein n=1 Tax=Streptomyces cupreus TaxID=2759956 RepID=A0A7X1J4F9_9ACTN|nr:hypothetical protein [Streptomyces cupreus]MBC2904005.1 hypothetical protein [Streptomyces cupreus]